MRNEKEGEKETRNVIDHEPWKQWKEIHLETRVYERGLNTKSRTGDTEDMSSEGFWKF